MIKVIIYLDVLKKLKENGYSQVQLCKKGIFSHSTLHRLRNGKPVTTNTIDTLCKLTGLPVEEIIRYEEDNMAAGHKDLSLNKEENT